MLHKGENLRVVGGGCQDQLPVAERVLNGFGHVAPRQVVHRHLRASLLLQLFRQQLHSLLRVAVYGSIADNDAFAFHAVGRPGLVKVEICVEILRQHRSVQRTDRFDFQCGCPFQQGLYLGAVLPDDAEIISSCLAGPPFRILRVQRAELAERVRGKQHLVRAVIGHNDFRPVNHRGRDELQGMGAQFQRIALTGHNPLFGEIIPVEVLHHRKRLGRSDNLRLRVFFRKSEDIGGMVRFHVLDNQVIRLPAFQRFREIVQPFRSEMPVHAVHHGNLPVQDYIGIICHAFRNNILSLKQVDLMVIDADIADILCDVHRRSLSCFLFFGLSLLYMYFFPRATGSSARYLLFPSDL